MDGKMSREQCNCLEHKEIIDLLTEQLKKAESVIERLINSEALKEAPFYNYCESITDARQYFSDKEGK
jgi:hypothetical protein